MKKKKATDNHTLERPSAQIARETEPPTRGTFAGSRPGTPIGRVCRYCRRPAHVYVTNTWHLEGGEVRRRLECRSCQRRWLTTERVDETSVTE